MKIGIIGSTGHWGMALKGLKGTGFDGAIAVAPGSQGESMAGVVEACKEIGHAPRTYDEYEDLLDRFKPTVASVACRFHDHAKVGRQVLSRGINLFMEKPLALTLDDLDALRKAYAASGVHLAAMQALRYVPAIQAAWKAVREGLIGEVRLLTAQKSYRLGNRAPHFRKRESFGGTIPWVGAHSIDLLSWFAGVPFTSVFAAHSTVGNRDHGELEASALCLFNFENQVIGSTNIDYLRPSTAPSHGDDRVRVAGTEGVVEVSGGKAVLLSESAEGAQDVPDVNPGDLFADFLAQVRGEGLCLVSAKDSFRTTEACLRARASADTGTVVQF
jgi:predicted dehydrogenase